MQTEKVTDKELLKIFPEAKEVIPEKITEWEKRRDEFSDTIKKELTVIKNKTSDDFSQWFWREWIKLTDGEELVKINSHIARLRRLQMAIKGKTPKSQITPEQIQLAQSVPLENIINQRFKKVGKTLIGLCSLHKEKHASFYIYLETNTCWCFGCQQGGNTINMVRKIHGLSFKDAVHYLIKQCEYE